MNRFFRLIRSAVPGRGDREDGFAAVPLTGRRRHSNSNNNHDGGYDDNDEDDDDTNLEPKDIEQLRRRHKHHNRSRCFTCESPSLRRWLSILLPFFIAAPLGLTDRKLPPTTSTTYLNGIRGLACWAVLNHHLTMRPDGSWIFRPWGCDDPSPEENHYLMQLPWVRALHAGKGMVCVFFALSGYVLAYSPARRMNAPVRPASYGDDMLTSLASATLRRAIRLFGPMLVVAFFMAFQTWYIPWAHNYQPLGETLSEHLDVIWLRIVAVLNPFRWDYVMPDPLGQAWTLGFEYRLSLLLFLVTLAVSRVKTIPRKLIILSVMLWSFYCDRRWDVFAFLGGTLVAETRFAPLADDFARVFRTNRFRPHRHLVTFLGWLAFVVGLMLCSVPEEYPEQGWPYSTFWWMTPEAWLTRDSAEPSSAWIWYYGGIGSVVLLWGIEQLSFLQKLLALTPFAYLGEISYAFYLMQNFAAQVVGWPLWKIVDQQLGWSHVPGYMLFYLSTQITCVVTADYFWRAVDLKFVVLARVVVVEWLGVGTKDGNGAGLGAGTGLGIGNNIISAAGPGNNTVVTTLAVPPASAGGMAAYSPGPADFQQHPPPFVLHHNSESSDDDDTLPVSDRESIENKPKRLVE